MTEETRIKLRETCRQMMANLESSMLKGKSPEDSIFYYHSSEDCIVLSHALFLVISKSLKGKVAKDARKLTGITMIAAGYAGDMSEDLCNDLLDDIDFHFNNVKCRKIEQMLPQLNKMVEEEINGFAANV